jgi:UDPglucose 6-dehydrogenase
VSFVDTSPARVEALRADGLYAMGEVDLRGPRALVMLSVPTPAQHDGYDLATLRAAVTSVGGALAGADEPPVVVLRCTVSPGTLEGVVQPILEETSGLRLGDGFTVASNPEFLRARCALEDFLNPWMTVVASRSSATRDLMQDVYRPFGGQIKCFTDPAAAELVKVAHNVFNATKISFFNELWMLATALGVDAHDIADTIARSAEGSWNPMYGIQGGRPFGGACLPKDLTGFVGFARQGGHSALFAEAACMVNGRLAGLVEDSVIDLRQEPIPAPALG